MKSPKHYKIKFKTKTYIIHNKPIPFTLPTAISAENWSHSFSFSLSLSYFTLPNTGSKTLKSTTVRWCTPELGAAFYNHPLGNQCLVLRLHSRITCVLMGIAAAFKHHGGREYRPAEVVWCYWMNAVPRWSGWGLVLV